MNAPETISAAAMLVEGRSIVESLDREEGLPLRLIGGVAIAIHCPQTTGGQAHREFGDLDAVTTSRAARRVAAALEARGYEPDKRFNAAQGDRRMIFVGPAGKLDVFVGRFEMCHRIELADRVVLESPTLTAADLLVTKLQIVELNQKDADDIALLLLEHGLGEGAGDHIDRVRLGALVGGDWGLWKTMVTTLGRVGELRPDVADRAAEVTAALDAAPKGRAFRMRARIGERRRWYELPEETP